MRGSLSFGFFRVRRAGELGLESCPVHLLFAALGNVSVPKATVQDSPNLLGFLEGA